MFDQVKLIIGNKNYSSWSLRAWVLLRYCQIPFEEEVIYLDRPGFKKQILSQSGAGTVPILKLGAHTISDSLAICETIADQFPEKNLWPSDPIEKAKARAVACEMHSSFGGLRTMMPMDVINRFPGASRYPNVKADVVRIFDIWQECLTAPSNEGAFLFGEFGVVDAMFAPVVSRFKTYGVTGSDPVNAYCEAVWTLPAMQDWIKDAEEEVKSIGLISDF